MPDPTDRLLSIMVRLRDPLRGCDWDVAQSFATIAPYTIEEAYEVADAVHRNDMADLRDELGDLRGVEVVVADQDDGLHGRELVADGLEQLQEEGVGDDDLPAVDAQA